MARSAVDWRIAERIAVRVAGNEPFAESYLGDSLQADFERATALAEELVEAETGLRPAGGPARARVTDRAEWARANVASFQRLLRPVTTKLGERLRPGASAALTTRMAGLEVGTLLGWMSTRVLGQYDLLVIEDEDLDDQDVVYYVGPNVLALEKRFAFPPEQFRLWLALHEVTHRAQFTGVPWLRQHYLSLVESTLTTVETDPRRLVDAVRRAAAEARQGERPLASGGLVSLLAGPAQRAVLDQVAGLMSLLEGHGDVTMARAAGPHVPGAQRFARVLHQRRVTARPLARVAQRLLGFEAKLDQYAQGERFIHAVEAVAGPRALDAAWSGPEGLPSLAEIRDPDAWLARVGPPRVQAAV